jgi:AcrR family transcriptional regulator
VNPRPYQSPSRDAAASQTRDRILAAAAAILGTAEGIEDFSLQAVAKKAGVTRLTVYNQFGSRRALLEAVFDERAARGGLHRLGKAMATSDPRAALRQVIGIFCEFWTFDPGALGLLHAAGAGDPDLALSVGERNERRRRLFVAIVRRITADGRLPRKAERDLVDTLFALTSFWFFSQLATGGRSATASCRIIQEIAMDAVRRALAGKDQARD